MGAFGFAKRKLAEQKENAIFLRIIIIVNYCEPRGIQVWYIYPKLIKGLRK
jgi:hypothetical protein